MLEINTISEEIMDNLDQAMVSPDTGDDSPNHSQVAQTIKALADVTRYYFPEEITDMLDELGDQVLQDAEAKDLLNIPVTVHRDLWNENGHSKYIRL